MRDIINSTSCTLLKEYVNVKVTMSLSLSYSKSLSYPTVQFHKSLKTVALKTLIKC